MASIPAVFRRESPTAHFPAGAMLKFAPHRIVERHYKIRIWVLSSVGRASPLQGECRRFEPVSTHQKLRHDWHFVSRSPAFLAVA